MEQSGAVVVVGAGPGVGAAVARRFGREGYPVGLIARNRERLDGLVRDLQGHGVRSAAAVADARELGELRAALRELQAELGPTQVLCFSPLPDIGLIKRVTDTTAEDISASLSLNVVAAAAAVQELLPGMRRLGRSTLLFTTGGAALAPSAERATSGIVYAAETVYVRMLHEALATEGIHASQTVIKGAVGPGLKHEPAAVAERLWQSHVDRDDVLHVLE